MVLQPLQDTMHLFDSGDGHMARRTKSLHHNLQDKNVVFHREHRSKKGRRPKSLHRSNVMKKRRLEELYLESTPKSLRELTLDEPLGV